MDRRQFIQAGSAASVLGLTAGCASTGSGAGGNVVMSGHNNILGAVFRELDQLKRGDEAVVWSGGKRYTYTVDRVMVVPATHAKPEQRIANAQWIGPFDDDRLTLVSCWPRNDNTHRIIVVAHLAGEAQAQAAN